eukprot:g6358.t1
MSGLRDSACLRHFGGLTAIYFINVPNLTSLSGLDACCPGLESLNITECGLQTTEGLEGLTGLTALHLSSNHLQSLDGVKGMTRLRKLWANDNRIRTMNGLSSLEALEDLWLCRNRLTEIGDGLPLGRTLREVNLAHNRLGCFKELLKLAPLEGLRSLTLQDIHFGDNPVCGLSNYKTYVAYHLTQLTSLDMEMVSEESKAFANTVFLKKSMYYNMRSRIVKRHAGHVIRKATELCGEKAANLQTTLIHLQWQRKHVEQRLMANRGVGELDTEATTITSEETAPVAVSTTKDDGGSKARSSSRSRKGNSTTSTATPVAITSPEDNKRSNSRPATAEPEGLEVLQLMAKGQALSSAVMVVENVLHKMEEQLGAFKEVVGHACKRAVSELMLEFDTGGNVRFEEGRPGDVWFSSCADLVKSRVMPAAGKGSSSGVKVSRVIRIHNRFLKNRFDRCVREANAASVSAPATPCDAVSGRPAATVTSPSAASEGKATAFQRQQQQDGSPGDYSPPRLHRSLSSGGESLNDENKRQLESEGSGRCDAHVGDGGNHLGSSLSTNGTAWRITQGLVTSQHIGNSGSGRSVPKSESGRRDAAERAAAVDNSSGTTSTTGGSGSNNVSSASGRERRKGDKHSSSSSPRSLEYLFFTGRRGGTGGIEWGLGGREQGGGGGGFWGKTTWGTASTGDGNAFESWQPDLLKLAEDGFRLPDRSEAETETDAEESARLAESSVPGAGGASHSSSHSTWVREDTTEVTGNKASYNDGGGNMRDPPRPQSIVLSTHLSKTDIPGMRGDVALASVAQTCKVNSTGIAPPASIGLGNSEFVSPVCRVLVVKVYTGRTYRLPCGSPSGGSGGVGAGWGKGNSDGNVGRIPRPDVLREAWATGFKAVCVSEDGEMDEGGGRGGGDREGGHCLKNSSSRYQEWHVLDDALALPEYIIEFDFSPEMGKV